MKSLQQQLRRILSDYPKLRLAMLFGSQAAGNADPDSDIDLALLSDAPLDSRDVTYARLLTRHLLNTADFVPLQQRILAERRNAWIK